MAAKHILSHLALAVGGFVLLLVVGMPVASALPYALVLGCVAMMIGMVFGWGWGHGAGPGSDTSHLDTGEQDARPTHDTAGHGAAGAERR